MADDRQSQSQAAVIARRSAVSLAKAIEHKGQKLLADANSRIPDNDRNRVSRRRPDKMAPPPAPGSPSSESLISTRPDGGVNLIAFESKLDTTCCKRVASPLTKLTPSSHKLTNSIPRASASGSAPSRPFLQSAPNPPGTASNTLCRSQSGKRPANPQSSESATARFAQ